MAIKPKCDISKKELTEFGALLFSPPGSDGICKKYHISKDEFEKLKEKYNLK